MSVRFDSRNNISEQISKISYLTVKIIHSDKF